MVLFGWFRNSENKGNQGNQGNETEVVDENEVEIVKEKVVYAPSSLSFPQKMTGVGGSFLGIVGVSYLLDYIMYVAFGSMCIGVFGYDNEKFIGFINERGFLSEDVIQQFNDMSNNVSHYLTPAQVSEGVSKSVGVVKEGGWLSKFGMGSSDVGNSSNGVSEEKKKE